VCVQRKTSYPQPNSSDVNALAREVSFEKLKGGRGKTAAYTNETPAAACSNTQVMASPRDQGDEKNREAGKRAMRPSGQTRRPEKEVSATSVDNYSQLHYDVAEYVEHHRYPS
jgi:hypothetical protein